MVIRDPDSLTLVVLGKEAHLDISVTDDQWHHVAITWSGQTGKYVGYKDGIKIAANDDSELFNKDQVSYHVVQCRLLARGRHP